MTVAHTKHASGFDELEDHCKEFRSFRSEGSIRGHSERDERSVVSLNYGLNVRVSLFSVFRCFEALFLLLHCTGVFLCFGGVLTRSRLVLYSYIPTDN